jgi:hypothetical protein
VCITTESTRLTNDKDAFPSSAAFDVIASALSSDAERKDAIKKGGAIFAFTLKNEAGEQQTWHIDLKETGAVGKGLAPEGKKPGGKFILPSFCDLQYDTRLTCCSLVS